MHIELFSEFLLSDTAMLAAIAVTLTGGFSLIIPVGSVIREPATLPTWVILASVVFALTLAATKFSGIFSRTPYLKLDSAMYACALIVCGPGRSATFRGAINPLISVTTFYREWFTASKACALKWFATVIMWLLTLKRYSIAMMAAIQAFGRRRRNKFASTIKTCSLVGVLRMSLDTCSTAKLMDSDRRGLVFISAMFAYVRASVVLSAHKKTSCRLQFAYLSRVCERRQKAITAYQIVAQLQTCIPSTSVIIAEAA